jgi:hypothetical protein
LCAVSSSTRRARAFVPQISKRVVAVVTVAPIYLNASGFRDGNVFGI